MTTITRRSFMELAVAVGATAAWGQPFAIRSSTIIRAIEPAALLGFYQGVYTIGIAPGHGNPNSPHEPGWQSVAFEMFPANAPVYGSVEPTAGSTTVQAPRSSLRLIQRRK